MVETEVTVCVGDQGRNVSNLIIMFLKPNMQQKMREMSQLYPIKT